MAQRVRVAHVTTIDATLRFLLWSQLKSIQEEGYDVAGVSSPGPWVNDLRSAGIAHYPVPSLTRTWSPRDDLSAFLELITLFRRERFAVVHTHMPKSGVLGRLAARLAGVPIVVNTIHGAYGLEPGHRGRRFFTGLEYLAARASDFGFCQSREILDLLIDKRVLDPRRAAHLGNGVDLQYFAAEAVSATVLSQLRSDLGIPPGGFVVGTVGRLVRDKGYREFIAAARRVRQVRSDVHFVAVGPADTSKSDALSAEEIRAAEKQGVMFLGMRRDVRELLALMDVFVLASYREGFPRSAIEAAAMGKPLILTDIRGCREVVTHGRNGLLVAAGQVQPLARAVLQLVGDEGLRRRFGEESRVRAAREFDERRVHGRILDVYRELSERKLGGFEHGVSTASSVQR